MTDLLEAKQEREANIISTFLEMVRSHDGDFDVLDRLAKATSDLESLQLIIKSLSTEPQGRIAFETYPRIGEVDLEKLD